MLLLKKKMTPFAVEPVNFCFLHLIIRLLSNFVVFVTFFYRLYKDTVETDAVSGSLELATIVLPILTPALLVFVTIPAGCTRTPWRQLL
jgi:hypothetical protein